MPTLVPLPIVSYNFHNEKSIIIKPTKMYIHFFIDNIRILKNIYVIFNYEINNRIINRYNFHHKKLKV